MARKSDTGMFTKADYTTLISTRRQLNDLVTTMDKAEACGVDCATWRAQVKSIDEQLARIQQLFMTPPPAA